MTAKKKPNIDVIREGSFVRLMPRDVAARRWLLDNVQAESWQWFPDGSLAVDQRFADPIVQAIQGELS